MTKLRLGLLSTSLLGSIVSIAAFDGAQGDTSIKERQVWTRISPKVAELLDGIDVGLLDTYNGVTIDVSTLQGKYMGIVVSKDDIKNSMMMLGDNPAPVGISDTGTVIHYVDVQTAIEQGIISDGDVTYTDAILVLAAGVSADKVLDLYPNHLDTIDIGDVAAYFAKLNQQVDPAIAAATMHQTSNGLDKTADVDQLGR